jgi:hypothetical protein
MEKKKNDGFIKEPLTRTITEEDEQNGKGFEIFEPLEQMWRVNPADEKDDRGTVGYKDA